MHRKPLPGQVLQDLESIGTWRFLDRILYKWKLSYTTFSRRFLRLAQHRISKTYFISTGKKRSFLILWHWFLHRYCLGYPFRDCSSFSFCGWFDLRTLVWDNGSFLWLGYSACSLSRGRFWSRNLHCNRSTGSDTDRYSFPAFWHDLSTVWSFPLSAISERLSL